LTTDFAGSNRNWDGVLEEYLRASFESIVILSIIKKKRTKRKSFVCGVVSFNKTETTPHWFAPSVDDMSAVWRTSSILEQVAALQWLCLVHQRNP